MGTPYTMRDYGLTNAQAWEFFVDPRCLRILDLRAQKLLEERIRLQLANQTILESVDDGGAKLRLDQAMTKVNHEFNTTTALLEIFSSNIVYCYNGVLYSMGTIQHDSSVPVDTRIYYPIGDDIERFAVTKSIIGTDDINVEFWAKGCQYKFPHPSNRCAFVMVTKEKCKSMIERWIGLDLLPIEVEQENEA